MVWWVLFEYSSLTSSLTALLRPLYCNSFLPWITDMLKHSGCCGIWQHSLAFVHTKLLGPNPSHNTVLFGKLPENIHSRVKKKREEIKKVQSPLIWRHYYLDFGIWGLGVSLRVLSISRNWPARPVGLQMECTNLRDWFFKMAHSESSVRSFEAIPRSGT